MGIGSASKRPLQPISALNPYNNNWSIKAKVVAKQPKRAFSKGFLLNVELVDEQGTAIEATFWRDAADRADELLEEGKVRGCARRRHLLVGEPRNRGRRAGQAATDGIWEELFALCTACLVAADAKAYSRVQQLALCDTSPLLAPGVHLWPRQRQARRQALEPRAERLRAAL